MHKHGDKDLIMEGEKSVSKSTATSCNFSLVSVDFNEMGKGTFYSPLQPALDVLKSLSESSSPNLADHNRPLSPMAIHMMRQEY